MIASIIRANSVLCRPPNKNIIDDVIVLEYILQMIDKISGFQLLIRLKILFVYHNWQISSIVL